MAIILQIDISEGIIAELFEIYIILVSFKLSITRLVAARIASKKNSDFADFQIVCHSAYSNGPVINSVRRWHTKPFYETVYIAEDDIPSTSKVASMVSSILHSNVHS